jgi:hypothetical protein
MHRRGFAYTRPRTRESMSNGTQSTNQTGSHVLGLVRRILPEEPTGVIPHGGICEGGGSAGATGNLNGHAAGNGGYGQGKPTVSVRFSPTWRPEFGKA